MKKLHKFRHLIGFVLAVAVSVMLLVSSVPVSAAEISLPFASFYSNPNIKTFGNVTTVYRESKDIYYNGGSGTWMFHNSQCGPLGRVYRDQSKNADFKFSVLAPTAWKSGFDNNQLFGAFVFRGMNDEIEAIQGPYSSYAVSHGGLSVYTFVLNAGAQYGVMDQVLGWGQADVVGVGIRSNGGYSGYVTFSSASHSPVVSESSSGITWDKISGFFRNVQSKSDEIRTTKFSLLGIIFQNSIGILTDKVTKAIDNIGVLSNVGWNFAKPVLKPIIEECLLPTLNSILNAVNVIVSETVRVFTPLIADIINFFSPYFNAIADIVTNNFLNLVENLTPLVNKFVTAISPSLDSIVTNISGNISRIIKECFVPSDTSAEYQEFVGMKDEITNKFPVFNQVKSFVTALFNPEIYSFNKDDYSYSLLKYYGNISIPGNESSQLFYSELKANNSYYLSFDLDTYSSNTFIRFYSVRGNKIHDLYIKRGHNSVQFSLPEKCNTFYLLNGNSEKCNFSAFALYSIVSIKAPSDFIVNVYGEEVSVLNFDWYMPYKKYGDVCVIAFCYLAFVWRTFKRLPSII